VTRVQRRHHGHDLAYLGRARTRFALGFLACKHVLIEHALPIALPAHTRTIAA
jgi:hypothetical protein